MKKSDRSAGEWYYDFLEACLFHGKFTFNFIYFLRLHTNDSTFYRFKLSRGLKYLFLIEQLNKTLDHHMAELAAQKAKPIIFNENIIETDKTPSEPRSQSDYAHVRQISGILR